MATAGSILGHSVLRREDAGLLTGGRSYVDDLDIAARSVVFVRSDVPHGRIVGISGGEGVFTAEDLQLPDMLAGPPAPAHFGRPALATGTVGYVGDPVAVVVGDTLAEARDRAEEVIVEIEELPGNADPMAASEVVFEVDPIEDPGALEGADVVVSFRYLNQKIAPAPMETNGILAVPDFDGAGRLRLWVPTQSPFSVRQTVADCLRLDPDRIHVVVPATGGGFGAKGHAYVEQVVTAALAVRLGEPLLWVESRTENMLHMGHARGQVQDVQIGARADGTVVGMTWRVTQDAGAYPDIGAWLTFYTKMMASGTYRIPRIDFRARSVITNTAPTGALRGAGRPEAAATVERAMDLLAAELGMDPVEVRRRNLIETHSEPVVTPTGAVYDAGDYLAAMERAVDLVGYDELRAAQAERRRRGDRHQLGIGVANYIEVTGNGPSSDYGSVEIHDDGTVTVLSGVSSHGQGHQTTYAQIASEQLGIPWERITVVQSDTDVVPRGNGTYGSRSLQLGGSAIDRAAAGVVDQARQIAADHLEANVEDITVYHGAGLGVAGSPDTALPWSKLAELAAEPLAAECDFDQGARTFPFGTHVAVVEVDTETGGVRQLRHLCVDDCGNVINPLLAEGQQHGGVAQGIAQALWEEMVFDAGAGPRTTNFGDYLIPSAAEFCDFETHRNTTPTPLNPLGAKGIGEAGTVGATPAVQSAVIDALAPYGVRHLDMPLTPERVWRALAGDGDGAQRGTAP
ncbi:MAG: xanthine dehydrogenase family protein molybdopterin-binding subunit [bacterium]|nr:xanthine dehydrogenase family protein molybdopterin-binding subunit [bacterium]MXZ30664.1 xanthine dehydrogenase family protein molybdopterin-binding subunit [Acidimicrobiia bacterium]MYE67179.1 xanthine dehydrogenase family protein molybdopterin-binding subunit [Acidimicrobiia bacterium]MYJ13267.1 xanthine dehydrogenase family protein molybdopterin-binding subunit [Acidimicrobiia bacterium]